jgi:hypothetical protein
MKLGILLLVVGVLLLILSIFIGVLLIVRAFNQFDTGESLPAVFNYIPVVTVVLGLVLTTIGATRLSFRANRK